MMDRIERFWVLIAILIGFYGNWYFNLLTRLEESQNAIVWLICGVSAFSLFMYCAEITIWRNTCWRVALAGVHLFTTYFATVTIEGWFPPTPTALLGIFLWLVILMYERKFAKLS
jgi:hypothetical protein